MDTSLIAAISTKCLSRIRPETKAIGGRTDEDVRRRAETRWPKDDVTDWRTTERNSERLRNGITNICKGKFNGKCAMRSAIFKDGENMYKGGDHGIAWGEDCSGEHGIKRADKYNYKSISKSKRDGKLDSRRDGERSGKGDDERGPACNGKCQR